MADEFKYDVFLSHSSKDKKIVLELAERLRADGIRVWFDEWEIEPGHSIPAKIEEGLEQSRVLLLCMSENAFGSEWAQLESGTFRFRDPLNKQRRFIPLRLDNTPIKGSLAQFLYINWLPGDRVQTYAKLLRACRPLAGALTVETRSPNGEPGTAPILVTALPSSDRYRRRGIGWDVIKGFLFILFVLSIKLVVERTTFGKQVELVSYDLLQEELAPQEVPITVIDISDLAQKDFTIADKTVTATPREPLRQLLEAIAAQNPKAIGIDMDFSPDENGYILPTDPEFFQFCLDLGQRGVPVFLGFHRTIRNPNPTALGQEKYQFLAANIMIPKEPNRMGDLVRVSVENPATGRVEQENITYTLSSKLADAYGRQPRDAVVDWLAVFGFIERASETQLGPGFSIQDFLVDYRFLDQVETIRTTNAVVLKDTSQRQRLEGKIVILGNATLGVARDTFAIQGHNKPYPGVLLHACAAYTLIKSPRYEFTGAGRIVFDIILSGALFAAITFSGSRYGHEESPESASNRLQGTLTILVVLSAITSGIAFFRVTRIMWNDFILALTFLVFHPAVKYRLEGLSEQVRKAIFPARDNRASAHGKARNGPRSNK